MEEVALHPELQTLMELVQELGFNCRKTRTLDGPTVMTEVSEGNSVALVRKGDLLLCTDKIPGIPMILVGLGNMRYQVRL